MAPMDEAQAQDAGGSLDVAIVGMSCRFPGSDGVEAFWRNLREGVECIRFFSDEELLARGVPPEVVRAENFVKASPILERIDEFDAAFFGYSPREAELLDPQHRLFLECSWEALESAGFDHDGASRSVGVFAGTSLSTYLLFNLMANPGVLDSNDTFQLMIGNDKDFLGTRVSYTFDLRGPSLDVQTGCSTSLVATHLACQALLSYQCDVALAGGVSVHMPQKTGYLYQPGGITTPDGHCRPFDAEAKGTLFGSGAGVVVLKRLEDALADGDTIYAVIKGTAINNDGSTKVGYTAPSVEGQVEVIARAQSIAGVSPDSIGYVEAHGTGTALGDPVEVSALTQVFREGTDQVGFCGLGSVKSNIGHLDAAAGVAGLIKAALALKHGQLPPTLHFNTPNPNIDWARNPFFVNAKLQEWKRAGGPRRAGINSVGIGGTNAHAVLEEAPAPAPSGPSRPWQLLVLSARTPSALEESTRRLAAHLESHPELPLADVAHTLRVGRKAFPHRRVVVCKDREDALAALGAEQPERLITGVSEGKSRSVVFMFPGGGAQYTRMGQELYETEPVFRESLDRCADILSRLKGLSIREVLFPRQGADSQGEPQLTRTSTALPALFAVEYSLARLWMSWGIQPASMIGHSMGEYVAACLAGVFSLEDALALVAERGRLFDLLPRGAMLGLALPEDQVRPLIGERLSIAAVNAPEQCAVAGESQAIEALAAELESKGIEFRRIHIDVAAHSPMVEPIMEAFRTFVRRLELRPPTLPFVSCVSGAWITEAQAMDPEYWVRHLRETVRFSDGIRLLLGESSHVFLEVAPGRTLSSLARLQGVQPPPVAVASMRGPRENDSDVAFLLGALGRLWLAGVKVAWPKFTAPEQRRRVPLPAYPFERKRHWVEPLPPASDGARNLRPGKRPDVADWFYLPNWRPSLVPRPAVTAPQQWLLFVDSQPVGERLAGQLVAAGHGVATVVPGDDFRQLGETSYAVDPRRRETYAALLGELARREQLPDRVVHLWSLSEPGQGDEGLERAQQLGFDSLLFLGQALGTVPSTSSRHLVVISSGAQAVGAEAPHSPDKATLEGPCRVLPREYRNLTCKSVDVALASQGGALERLVRQLAAEILGPAVNATVAYRGLQRYEQAFEPVRMEALPAPAPRLRPHGVYLITGGLGGIGLVLAEHLARKVQARLVLVGRSPVPPREQWEEYLASRGEADPVSQRVRKLRALEALGAQVLVLSADVADAAQMEAALGQVRATFGELNGVIHAAGLPAGGLIQLKTPEAVASIFRPKVQGARVLDRLLADTPLDFFLLCSSKSATVGDFGQVDHCAANAYLNALAAQRAAEGRPFSALAWDTWREVGQAVTTELPGALARYRQVLLEHGLTPTEGLEVFDRVLAELPPHVVISTEALPVVLTQGDAMARELASLLDVTSVEAGAAPAEPLQLAGAEVEQKLAGVWQRLLGVERVGAHDNFFDLGGNSLIGLRIIAEIKRTLGVDLPTVSLFERPTISALARLITRSPDEVAEEAATVTERRSRGARRRERLQRKLETE